MALEKLANNLRIIGAFELSLAVFTGNSLDISGQTPDPEDVSFNSDGTRMFVLGETFDVIYQYDLTTGFDVSTASFTGTSFDVSGQDSQPRGIAFNPDGTKMFMIGTSVGAVFQYDLTTGFDVSTASFSGASFDVSGQDTDPQGVTFNPDGTKMFIIGRSNDSVFSYSLSNGFDLSTASFDNSFDVSGQETNPRGVTFSTDGTRMFIAGGNSDSVFQYSLTTGFGVFSASFTGTSFDVSGQDKVARDITFNPDGTRMFIIGSNSDSVFEYPVGRLALQE